MCCVDPKLWDYHNTYISEELKKINPILEITTAAKLHFQLIVLGREVLAFCIAF